MKMKHLFDEADRHKTALELYKELRKKKDIESSKQIMRKSTNFLDEANNKEANDFLTSFGQQNDAKKQLYKILNQEEVLEDSNLNNFFKVMRNKVKVDGLVFLIKRMVIIDNLRQISELELQSIKLNEQIQFLKIKVAKERDSLSEISLKTDSEFLSFASGMSDSESKGKRNRKANGELKQAAHDQRQKDMRDFHFKKMNSKKFLVRKVID